MITISFFLLFRPPETVGGERASEGNSGSNCSYNIEFSFDSDVRCSISIKYFCKEEVTPNGTTYVVFFVILKSNIQLLSFVNFFMHC